ncbi:MAG: UDP-N-acetylmuramate dehydrogenase [Anaerolineales bacterium]|jgi:UDP-N-acetylmuramate dehydrogenase|nr:UDP-N-acetylmuramate dehydrogenase [Anaerolineales bacterium]
MEMDQLWQTLEAESGLHVQRDVPLARFTAARLGGPADALLEVHSTTELVRAVRLLWKLEAPFALLGGGSNVLVSDSGYRGLVLINRARKVRFDLQVEPPVVLAEAGVNFGALARQAAGHGLAGLEWAAGIPGSLGGAIYGNAGAHGGDTAGNLLLAEILHHPGQMETWPVEKFAFAYRRSLLKQTQPGAGKAPSLVILSATLQLERSTPEEVQAKMDAFVDRRRSSQPPGASLGSMFKNPPGDYAGRLIEAAGLKGYQVGGAQISPIHANFFINIAQATAADLRALIALAQQTVLEKFGVSLELEVELFGEW